MHDIKKYNLSIWSDFTYTEKQIYKLYEAFQHMTRKRGQKETWLPQVTAKAPKDANHIRAHKNWKYFKECYCNLHNPSFLDGYKGN